MREKKNKKNKGWSIVLLLMLVIVSLSNIYLLYSISLLNGIENLIRAIFVIIIIGIWFLLIRKIYKTNKNFKIKTAIILIIISLIYSLGSIYISYNIDKAMDNISGMTSKSTTYSSSIITLKDNKASTIDDTIGKKIGILDDTNSIDGNQIPNEVIKEKKISDSNVVKYDSFIDALTALYDKKIEFIFVPTNYDVLFKNIEKFENIKEETKIIFTKDKKVKNTNTSKGNKIDKPFTILLMGVDSPATNIKNASFNGDALMLVTFNPKTLNATIMSIPRDSYVPIACFDNKRNNKITHAAWYGEDCMMKTIEGFTGIDIDYYFKINFKGVVKLVDALGGVNIDVEYSFCEQNSNRQWGENTIYVKKGKQNLNGEQALAYSRNRHEWPTKCSEEWNYGNRNDFIRGQHQQEVVKAIMNKAKNIRSVDKLQELLKTISMSMETNMNTNEILSFYNIAKDILAKSQGSNVDELLGMQKLYLSGYDSYIYDYDAISGKGTKLTLYNYVLYKGSLADVIKAMKINLGLEEATINKSFSFDINNKYEEIVIGKGTYNESKIELLPSFIGQNQNNAISYGSSNGITVNVKKVSKGSGYFVGQIIDQSLPSGMDIKFVDSITITVVDSITTPTPPKTPTNTDKDTNNKDDSSDTDTDTNEPLDPVLPDGEGEESDNTTENG